MFFISKEKPKNNSSSRKVIIRTVLFYIKGVSMFENLDSTSKRGISDSCANTLEEIF